MDLTTLTMYTAEEVSHLCSAVTIAIVLEYTTVDQDMKLEWNVVSVMSNGKIIATEIGVKYPLQR